MKCRVRSQKQLDKLRSDAVHRYSPISITAMLTVCESKLHFGNEKIRKAAKEISNSYDSISKHYISFEDLKECLHDYDGVQVPFDFEHKQSYDTIDDAEALAAYAQKAFACAVLCTVLCDKFGFRTVKAQQAVNQVCDTFDHLKDNRRALNEQKTYFLKKYGVLIS